MYTPFSFSRAHVNSSKACRLKRVRAHRLLVSCTKTLPGLSEARNRSTRAKLRRRRLARSPNSASAKYTSNVVHCMYTQIEDYTNRYLIVYRLQPSTPQPQKLHRMLRAHVSATRGVQRPEIGPLPCREASLPFCWKPSCGRENEGNNRSRIELKTRRNLQRSPSPPHTELYSRIPVRFEANSLGGRAHARQHPHTCARASICHVLFD